MAVRIESHAEPIPGYRLIERLGQGGFGEVWKAEAPGGLLKAIKFVYGEIDAAGGDAQRAEQELKAMRRVQTVRHPYILSLERYDIIDGQLIIVMELADKNLWDRFKECRAENLPGIPREELLQYMEESAEALDLMNNTYNLQHLDIKPQNLFVVHNHVKVADFGLVKDLEGMAASVTGGVTPVYAAPETFDQWVSRFSDQYSLAIVYQELLTGQRPFPGNNVRQLILQHLQGTPNLSSLLERDRPIIARALEKIPDQRHPTCQDMVRLLRGAGSAPQGGYAPRTDPLLGTTSDTPSAPSPPLAAPALSMLTPQRSGHSALTPVIPLSAPSTPCTEDQRSQRPTRWLGAQSAPPTPSVTASSKVPSDLRAGDGCLLPALVLGVGGAALGVLGRLRASLAAQLGKPDDLPHLRLLYIDTDAEALKRAARTLSADGLDSGATLLARINRPSHYLKPRDGRAEIDSWLDTRMLYRITRAQQTGGVRALGRLAFCDNFRLIAHRIQGELEACLDPEGLKATARRTRLGVRTSQPRVYVVAGLAGGSGGGMFLDLAYVVRDLLRQNGFADPDVVGLLLVPPTQGAPGTPLVLGNTFAALTELHHFSRGGPFSARYLDRGPGITDSGAPFQRSVILELPAGSEGESGAVGSQMAEFLARDLCSPLGQALDRARQAPGASYQTFGLYKIAFPRRDLSTRAGRRICRDLVARWMSKDGAPVRAAAREWVDEQWSRDQFGPETFIEKMHEGVQKKLGRSADAGFAEVIKPLAGRAALDPEAVSEVLNRLEEQVGVVTEETMADVPTLLQETLRDVGDAIVADWGQRLAELVVALIESPDYRLAGAEEAIRYLVASLQKTLEHHEPLGRELASRAAEAHARIHALIALLRKPPQKGRPLPTPADVLELLRCYPKWHYQSQVLQQVSRGLVSLRGLLSDELREVNFCRTRLAELKRAVDQHDIDEDATAGEQGAKQDDRVPGRSLYPGGTTTLADAVDHVLKSVSAEDLARLDADVQAMIHRQFRALVHVCLAPANLLRNLEVAMQEEAEKFLAGVLSSANAAELLLAQYASPEEAGAELENAFQEAAPDLSARGTEVCLLAVPAGPAGERIRELARRTLSDVRLLTVVGGDDILFYREAVQLSLGELEHLGPKGQEAYRQLTAAESFTPHSRADVSEWRVVKS